MRALVVLIPFLQVSAALFSEDFTRWLDKKYGVERRQYLERGDLQNRGSFGGKKKRNEKLHRNPVVFVHGVSHVAGSLNREMAYKYKEMAGYTDAELYSTTYDDPKDDKMRWMQYTMKCDHVKRTRLMIEAVHAYTRRKVDVIAFSLGVLISRKAILGGRCVESNEDIGGRLTGIVGTYVGVAGPNKGVAPVLGGLPFALCSTIPMIPICNPIDGLFSGFCPFKSRFIDDINYQSHYEGGRVYSIGSRMDEVVGHMVCFDVTTQMKNQDGEKIYNDKKHEDTFKQSADVQIAMLNGKPF